MSAYTTHPGLQSFRTDAMQCRYDPTIEDSYSVTRNIDGTTFSLAITDTAGQEEYRSLWSSSNLHSDAFLLVYDITQQSSLRSLEWFNELIEQERERRMERGKVLPVCIVAGNKCDLQGIRQVGATEGLNWARSRGYGFMETSAREMVNIEETFARMFAPTIISKAMLTFAQFWYDELWEHASNTWRASHPTCHHRPQGRGHWSHCRC